MKIEKIHFIREVYRTSKQAKIYEKQREQIENRYHYNGLGLDILVDSEETAQMVQEFRKFRNFCKKNKGIKLKPCRMTLKI